MKPFQVRLVELVSFLLLLTLFPAVFSGCWGFQEIDETAFVLNLGLDRGIENKLTWTAQVAIPREIAGSGGSGGGDEGGGGAKKGPDRGPSQGVATISVDSPTFTGAVNMMDIFLDRRISLKHLKTVIFSEPLAREGIMTYLGVMAREPEFRRSVIIAVSRNVTAKALLENNTRIIETNPAKHSEIITEFARFSGYIPAQPQFFYFYDTAKSLSGDPVCILAGLERKVPQGEGPPVFGDEWVSDGAYYPGQIPRSGGNGIEITGAAVFQDDRLVGEINGDEMTGLMLIRGTFNQANISLADPLFPDKMLGVNLRMFRNPQIKVDLSGPVPWIRVKVYLEGALTGMQTTQVNYEEPLNRLVLEEAINRRIQAMMETVTYRAQHEFQADILHLGKYVKHQFWTYPVWVEYNWLEEKFPQAEISLEVQTHMRRFGLLHEVKPLSRELLNQID